MVGRGREEEIRGMALGKERERREGDKEGK